MNAKQSPSREDTRALWDSGVPISHAPLKFGDPAKARMFLQLRGRGGVIGLVLNAIAEQMGKPELLDPKVRHPTSQSDDAWKVWRELEDKFLARLLAGEFIAVGYAVPRKPEDLPCRVPADLLKFPAMNVEAARAEAHGLRIEDVRVIPAGPMTQQAATPQRGRPTERALILAAYDACQRTGLIDYTKHQIRAVETIRRWIQKNRAEEYGAGRGFGDEAIRQAIAEDFRSKAHRKQ